MSRKSRLTCGGRPRQRVQGPLATVLKSPSVSCIPLVGCRLRLPVPLTGGYLPVLVSQEVSTSPIDTGRHRVNSPCFHVDFLGFWRVIAKFPGETFPAGHRQSERRDRQDDHLRGLAGLLASSSAPVRPKGFGSFPTKLSSRGMLLRTAIVAALYAVGMVCAASLSPSPRTCTAAPVAGLCSAAHTRPSGSSPTAENMAQIAILPSSSPQPSRCISTLIRRRSIGHRSTPA